MQIVSYRLISLFDVLKPAPQIGSTYYQATLQADRLRLSGSGPDEQDDSGIGPLEAMIRAAISREWKASRAAYSRQLERLASAGGQMSRLSEWLLNCQPGDMRRVGDRIPQNALAVVRELSMHATKILERKTIFLVPDYMPESCVQQSNLGEVLRLIAEELGNYLDIEAPLAHISFLKIPRPKYQTTKRFAKHLDDPGIMRSIIGRLFIESNRVLEREATNKEGPLLIDGPTGTGKSMAAELIALDQGKDFIKVNIAAVTETLLESQMRGYIKGAFTGAAKDEDGWFAKADGGILFLDEFQNASLVSQTQLLDLLDPVSNDIYVGRIGESHRRKFNVKVILAVNKPVGELLSTGKLREDLFYRIRNIVKLLSFNDTIKRSKTREDRMRYIKRLFHLYRWKSSPYWGEQISWEVDFVSLFPEIDESVMAPLENYWWKGNYRQFERVVSDIYWRNDREHRSLIDNFAVQEQLEEERRRLGSDTPLVCDDDMAQNLGQMRLRTVENLLQANGCIIEKTLRALASLEIGLKSRVSLRFFLNEHRDSLRPEIRTDSRIVSFMQGRRSARSDDRPGFPSQKDRA